MRVWVNGSVLSDPAAGVIAVDDHGVTVGDGVFESVKVEESVPFALTRHLDRLATSARGLGLDAPDLAAVREGVAAVLSGARGLGRLRITYTAGRAPMGSGRSGGLPTVVVAYGPLAPAASSVTVRSVPWARNERGATAGLKTTSYAENVIALAHAQAYAADEAIFANTVGNLCEGTGSNIFYVVDGELRTPTLASGCLAGVTRALVLEWCDAREVDEPLGEALATMSEAFLVSTTRDVQPIARFDERTLPAPGPVTAHCAQVWAQQAALSVDP